MSISQKLKDARKLIGLSQSKASELSNIEQKDISLLESGKKKFIPEEYIQFLYSHGIDLNTLYNDDVEIALIGTSRSESASKNYTYPDTVPANWSEDVPEYGRYPPSQNGIVSKKPASPTASPKAFLTPKIITVNHAGNENIIYVPVRARAGYLTGYGDTEFVETLPSFSLPGLQGKTYRAFEVDGDSMYPTLENKEMVIGEWVESFDHIRDDRVYAIVTKNEGVIIKRLLNRIDQYGYIVAKSDAVNDRNLYPNIEVRPEDVLEIWYAVWHGGFSFKSPGDLWKRQNNLEADITEVMRILREAGLK